MSERFELRLDEEFLSRVDAWRGSEPDSPSRAEAMRRLAEMGLARASRDSVHISDGEKLIMLMLRDFYRHLRVKGSEIDPEFVAEVIWGGHSWALRWEMSGVFHGAEDDPRDVHEVVEVLDMWDAIERAYEGLPKKGKENIAKDATPFGKHVVFRGFDGNDEASHVGIARFLVEKLGRFSRFKGRDLNSHLPSRAVYQRMLQVFEPMRHGMLRDDLTADQIAALLRAQEYPKDR